MRVATTSPPDHAGEEVIPSAIAVLRRVPLPRARGGIHAAARARRIVLRKPNPPPPVNSGPFGALFNFGVGNN